MAKKLSFLKKDAVKDMIHALEEYAQEKGVSLVGNIPDDIDKLDDLFNDGGEGRTENFGDLAYNYSLQFGELDDYNDDDGFEAHLWSCIDSAMTKLRRKYGLNTAI